MVRNIVGHGWARRSRGLRWTLVGGAGLVIVMWAVLRFWLPGFVRDQAETALTEGLHRPVAIQSIEIEPFALALTVRGVRIGEADAPLLAFDDFHVNVSIASLWHRAPVISAVRLSNPAIHLSRDEQGRLSIADLMGPSDTPVKDEKPAGPLPDFSVANVEIRGGQFVFDDRQKGSRQVISDLALGIPFAGTIEQQEETWVEPHFKAVVDGAPISIEGKVKPFTDRREATLELRLKDFDLTRIDEYVPMPPGLKIHSAKLDVALDARFVQSAGKPMALDIKGETTLRAVRVDHVGGAPYQARLDRLALRFDELDASLQKPLRAHLSAEGLKVQATGAAVPFVDWPKIQIDNVVVDLKQRQAQVDAVTMDGLRVVLQREADGRIDALRVLLPPTTAATKAADVDANSRKTVASAGASRNLPTAATAKAAPTSEPPAWSGRLGKFALNDAFVQFTDRTLTRAVPLRVEQLAVAVDRLDISGRTPAQVKFGARVNQRGRIDIQGQVGWAPLWVALDLDVADIDLVPLQGWAGDKFNVLVSRGQAGVRGKLNVQPGASSDAAPVIRFEGESKLAAFNVFDRQHESDVLNFKTVEVSGVKFVSAPLNIDVNRVLLDELFVRAILGADGKINFGQVVKSDPAAVAPPASTDKPVVPPTAEAPPPPVTRQAVPARIGEIVVRKSRVDFTDRFIKPPYHATLTSLDGRIAPLEAGKRGQIQLTGAVDRSAPLAISGEVDPFASEIYLNVAARVKGLDLPSLSTYAERHVGYQLQKGKLSLDLRYFIENRKLRAENKLFLDQLTFGDKVESPDAISVPVGLAVALLKNSRGEIDLDLPISGSLDDPQFSVMKIVFKLLGNLVVKAVSSPFQLLASAFGDGDELSEVAFLPGRATPEPEGEKRLQSLAKALTERPGLKIEITGQADPDADRVALGKGLLERRLRAKKLEATTGQGAETASLRDVTLSSEERNRYVQVLAKEAGLLPAATPNAPTGSAPAAGGGSTESASALEAALLARQTVGDHELRQLAERRGRGVRTWLVEQGKVPIERVFVMVPKVETSDGQGVSRALFSLR